MEFLSGLTGGGGGGGADIASSAFNTLIAGATGGFKNRPQWKDVSFMNDIANRLTPDEAGRQNKFLDITQPQETRRLTERIQSMGKDLGMSPWELTGTPGANPISAGPQGAGGSGSAFAANLVPLQIAKMNNATQLQMAKMSQDTQLKTAGVTPQKGSQQEAQRALTKSIETLTDLQGASEIQRKNQIQSDMFLSNLRFIAEQLPTFTTSLPGVSMTGKSGTFPILNAIRKQVNTGTGDPTQILRDTAGNIDTNRTNQLLAELKALANAGGHMLQGASNFLGQMTNRKQ